MEYKKIYCIVLTILLFLLFFIIIKLIYKKKSIVIDEFSNNIVIDEFSNNKEIKNKKNLLILKPNWGIGNRLRTIRKAYVLCKYLGRELVIVENNDTFFDHKSMKVLFDIDNILFIKTEDLKSFQAHKIKEKLFHKIKQKKGICETRINDEMKEILELNKNKENVLYIESCGLIFDDKELKNNDNSFYKEVSSYFTKNNLDIKKHFNISSSTKVVGIHIRQGSVSDYLQGNFFGKWENSNKMIKPYFPYFKDNRKNLSAIHHRAPPIEYFINIMEQYDKSVKFFICSDRTGVLLYLHQIFPDRILMNPLIIQTEFPNSDYGFKDLFMLSLCDEIIATGIGSFSREASIVRDIPIKMVWDKNVIT